MQDRIAERMEKYARASGHPRLVELLSRHANDQKDKFTLSDDEDQARVRPLATFHFGVRIVAPWTYCWL